MDSIRILRILQVSMGIREPLRDSTETLWGFSRDSIRILRVLQGFYKDSMGILQARYSDFSNSTELQWGFRILTILQGFYGDF